MEEYYVYVDIYTHVVTSVTVGEPELFVSHSAILNIVNGKTNETSARSCLIKVLDRDIPILSFRLR